MVESMNSHNPFLAHVSAKPTSESKGSALDDLVGLDLSTPQPVAAPVSNELQASNLGGNVDGMSGDMPGGFQDPVSPEQERIPTTPLPNTKNPFLSAAAPTALVSASHSLQEPQHAFHSAVTEHSSSFLPEDVGTNDPDADEFQDADTSLPRRVSMKDPSYFPETSAGMIRPLSSATAASTPYDARTLPAASPFPSTTGPFVAPTSSGAASTPINVLSSPERSPFSAPGMREGVVPSMNPYVQHSTPADSRTGSLVPVEQGVPGLGQPVASTRAGVAQPLSYMPSLSSSSTAVPVGVRTPMTSIPASTTGIQGSSAANADTQGQIDADAKLAQSLAATNISDETQWSVKDILWRGRNTKIIMQNANGPCALIALTNVLLLQNQIKITPPDRPAVSYAYVSDMLADYFLEHSTGRADAVELSHVLSTLPKLLHGFQVDVFFDRPTHFGSDIGADTSAELSLFRMANVPLLHGWLPDPSDAPTCEALQQVRSYNGATALLARQDAGDAADLSAARVGDFMRMHATQLTPWGLQALSQELLPGQLGVLFRNSHLSVIYRRRVDEGMSSSPQLYMLVTDSAFLMDDRTVWESLQDTRGNDTRFYDADFERVMRSEREWGVTANGLGSGTTDDYTLALRLQNEERERARAVQRARRMHADVYRDPQRSASTPTGSSSSKKFSKMMSKMRRKEGGGGDSADDGKNCKVM